MQQDVDEEILLGFLDEGIDILCEWERACINLQRDKESGDFDCISRIAHNLKGSAHAVGLMELEDTVHKIENYLNPLKLGTVELTLEALGVLFDCQSFLMEWLTQLKTDLFYKPSIESFLLKLQYGDKVEATSLPDVPALKKDEEQLLNQIIAENSAPVEQIISKPNSNKDLVPLEKSKKQEKAPASKSSETVRVTAEKIDKLIQIIGELSIHHSIIHHCLQNDILDSSLCHKAINLGNKILKEAQAQSLSLRMHNLSGLFMRLERISGDLSRKQGKLVNIELIGEEVDLDKIIIEAVTNPLVHIVRNSVDHGIETPNERLEKGKPEQGVLKISAKQDASGVVVTIEDDGNGLDRDRIAKKAIKMGIISTDEDMTDAEIYSLIFYAGFSTAEVVTDVSGRGVGMDVVKKAVDSVGGEIRIESELGKGTRFTINLPSTLSIIDVLAIEIEEERYLIPMQDLAEVIDLNEFSIEKSESNEEILNLRGSIIPIENLTSYFPQKKQLKKSRDLLASDQSKGEAPSSNTRPAVIVNTLGNNVAFGFDKLLTQQQVVIRPLNDQLAKIPGYSGTAILADGSPGMIISLKKIASRYIEISRCREDR